MSIYLRVERYGSEPALLRGRAPAITLGIGPDGRLTSDGYQAALFSLYSFDDRTLLESLTDGVSINGSPLTRGGQSWIARGDKIAFDDYEILCLPTSTTAEALAQQFNDGGRSLDDLLHKIELDVAELPFLQIRIGAARKTLPLYPGLALTIGSGPEDALSLPLPGVERSHCIVRFEECGVTVSAAKGTVRRSPGGIEEPLVSFTRSGFLYLAPLDIPVEVVLHSGMK